MKKIATVTAILLMAALPCFAAGDLPSISVSGTATVTVEPDTASFSLTASSLRDTTEEARVSTTEMIQGAVKILTDEFGVPVEDLSTSYITAYPQYRWTEENKQELVGQRCEQSLNVKIHDLASIGDVYTRLMSLTGIEISTVSLDKEDKSAELLEARMLAVKDARAKADAYTEAAGVSVGKVLNISDSSSYYPVAYKMSNRLMASAEMDSAPSTEFYKGDISVSASVSMVYEIIN